MRKGYRDAVIIFWLAVLAAGLLAALGINLWKIITEVF